MTMRRPHVLLIGPRIIEGDIVGGAKISFERLLADLRHRNNITLTVVSTSRSLRDAGPLTSTWLNLKTFVATLTRLWRHSRRSHVIVWNVSPRGAVFGGSFIWLLSRLRRRPLFVRVFGSSVMQELAQAPAIVRFVVRRTILKADILLLQTRQLAQDLSTSFNALWFPTTRHMPARRTPYRNSCRRLLFLGHLRPEKGLPELLVAADRFPPEVTLSVVGPTAWDFDPAIIDSIRNASYGGSVSPEDVPWLLETHDALVLPSRLEGYPGVIIEAFQMGLPAIATCLPPVRELVRDGQNGLLVAIGSVDSLVNAITRITGDDRLFQRLREDALTTGERFRSDRAAARLEKLCTRIAFGPNAPCAES